jgi:hypothetical protein
MQFRVELFRRAVTPHRWFTSRPNRQTEMPADRLSRDAEK